MQNLIVISKLAKHFFTCPHLYKSKFSSKTYTVDQKNYKSSHLIAIGNAKIKRGQANFSLVL